ncbi:MAG: rubrerythrin [Kiritimatiellae bacterium]|nr:rubrerythrin [Kiritimatiellia bacterium]
MPEFGSPFSVLGIKRRLEKSELVRAIRFMVAAEYEAIQMYMQVAEATSDKLVAAVVRNIADEERVHPGEFLRLLRELEPGEAKYYAEGAREVEEEMTRARGKVRPVL